MEGGTQLEEIVLGWGVLGDSVLSWSFLLLPPPLLIACHFVSSSPIPLDGMKPGARIHTFFL